MEKQYYMSNFTEEQKNFIKENLDYLALDFNYYGYNAYDFIIKNKLQCEYGVYLTTESNLRTFLVSLPKSRHYWKIGEAGKTSWAELESNFLDALKSHGVTLKDFQLQQRFSSIEYYSSISKWKIEEGKKLVFSVKDSYANGIVIDFLLYLTDGNVRENLAEAHKLIDENGTSHYSRVVFCVADTFYVGDYKIRCYMNGKVEITLKDKGSFSEAFIGRFTKYQEASEKVHKNCEWYTWQNG